MTDANQADTYRRELEDEGGQPVSAGARLSHVQAALDAGRGVYVDLSGVPEQRRSAVVAEIGELVRRAGGGSARPFDKPNPAAAG
jgi:hypothetical protein